MSPEDNDISPQGILATQIGYLREDIAELTRRFNESASNNVSYREWSQRNDHVNTRLGGLGREVGDLRTEIRAKSAPWWSVAAVIAAVAALAWNVFGVS